ncbi:beta-lactamase-like protein [Aspergillus keveii]|uniref:Beta-lactamase-like protein n=1 Tax=Aspergillus keveii TaxID=714993 RepID=A0ABR4FTR3_9EURO
MGASLPAPFPGQTYVTVSPINGGQITLPERSFVSPSGDAAVTVPSLSFLITHPGTGSETKPRYLLFDLGLRAKLGDYMKQQQIHLESRRPYVLGPGVAQWLRHGGIDPADIDTVILSHIHYDHHGDPAELSNAKFFVGAGSLNVLKDGLGISASHQFFDPDLFRNTTEVNEFPSPDTPSWRAVGPFEAALDFLGDGSVYVVDAPGHLPGHTNLLCRVGPAKWIYLGGDSCHDVRLLTGERQIATWADAHGNTGCIHVDKDRAEETLSHIRELMQTTGDEVEVVMAHDVQWWNRNRHRAIGIGGVKSTRI